MNCSQCLISIDDCSYIIQNFRDTLRQSIIDLLLGNITRTDEFQLNESLKVLTAIAQPPIEISSYYHYGALNNELQLAESMVELTRCQIKMQIV